MEKLRYTYVHSLKLDGSFPQAVSFTPSLFVSLGEEQNTLSLLGIHCQYFHHPAHGFVALLSELCLASLCSLIACIAEEV
jgi:hypothetical protein